MLDRISQLDPNVPVTFIYGSRSWMDLSSGYRTRVLLPNSYVDVKVGSHLVIFPSQIILTTHTIVFDQIHYPLIINTQFVF